MNTAIILILGIPLIEIYLFIKVGSQIGALNTVLLILFTALLAFGMQDMKVLTLCVQECHN